MKLCCLLAMMIFCPVLAHADIYKYVDEDGHVTYSSTPIKGGKKIVLEPLPTMAPPPRTPADFPKVDDATQKSRDDARRKILLEELSTEEKLLEEARQNLKAGEETPEVFVGRDGKTYRNVAKYEEKINALKDQIDLHSRNIEALQIELSKIK